MDSIIYEKICEKALKESKKKIVDNLANEYDIIEITIINNIANLTKETNQTIFKYRQNTVLQFINDSCKLLDKSINIVINIGLHDSYSSNLGILIFSSKGNTNNICIPDLYAMCEYSGKLNIEDNVEFENKKNKAIFIGAENGNDIYVKYNKRINLCNNYINNNNIKCYINKIYSTNDIKLEYPNYESFMHNGMTIQEQLKYKYIINVDGNTCAWDRLPWILNSKSLCLKKKSHDTSWYYDFMVKDEHYVEFDDDSEVETIINTISTNECKRIIKNANKFCDDYLKKKSQMTYMAKLLYYLSIKE